MSILGNSMHTRLAGRPSDTRATVGLRNDTVWGMRTRVSNPSIGTVCRRLGAYRTVIPFGEQTTQTKEKLIQDRDAEDTLESHAGWVHVLTMLVARGWERHKRRVSPAIAEETPLDETVLSELVEEQRKGEDISLPNIMEFLRPVGIMELNHLRAMSVLSTLTYGMHYKVRKNSMKRLGLEFVTSSHVCDNGMKKDKLRAQHVVEAVELGDGMSGLPALVPKPEGCDTDGLENTSIDDPLGFDSSFSSSTSVPWADSEIGFIPPSKYEVYVSPESLKSRSKRLNRDIPEMRPKILEYSDADLPVPMDIVDKRKNNITSFRKSTQNSSDEMKEDTTCPTHWYVADDTKNKVRYFVIQGSDNIDHWRVNLTFDPVQFESSSLGMKAHRGVYEAACKLYDIFLPLVQDYIEKYPHGTIAFTGHSLGGSLGTMLMLMFFHRGILKSSNLAPVHTFGSPAVFCGGESCSGNCSIDGEEATGVLEKLGLPHDSIRNVIMHKDIVPRAFACDYSILADFLKHIHECFREHHCLHGKRSVMFNTIGQTLIVQPDELASFVNGEGYHPLLPKGPQLLALKHSKSTEHLSNTDVHSSEEADPNRVESVEEAYWELMNFPHPLKILKNPGAYGDLGSISRYHNPDNYTKAIRGVLMGRSSNAHTILERVGQDGAAYRPRIDKDRRNDIFKADISADQTSLDL